MTQEKLILAVPSKGRLMEQTLAAFEDAGLAIEKTGSERGYQGAVNGQPNIEVAFLSASEIAHQLRLGRVHMGVTGEDLLRENISDVDEVIEIIHPLSFGHADVVVAVPQCWIDVQSVSDLEDVAVSFRRNHGRQLKVATKYPNLTRKFFSQKGVAGYRIVESLGATEGTPMAGTAELIVDITSTGATLQANHLMVIEDGIILKSQANLVLSNRAEWSGPANDACRLITERFTGAEKSSKAVTA